MKTEFDVDNAKRIVNSFISRAEITDKEEYATVLVHNAKVIAECMVTMANYESMVKESD